MVTHDCTEQPCEGCPTLQMWRVYQRGLERWIADLLQPVFDNLVTDGMVPRFVMARLWLSELCIATFFPLPYIYVALNLKTDGPKGLHASLGMHTLCVLIHRFGSGRHPASPLPIVEASRRERGWV